jgi:hypothetical protein
LAQSLNNNRIYQLVQPRKPWYIIIDDTVLEHPYGPCIQGTGKYWDNSEKRWTLGHNIVTSMAANDDNAEPLDMCFYLKKKYAETNNAVLKKKIQIACEIIRARAKQLNVKGVVLENKGFSTGFNRWRRHARLIVLGHTGIQAERARLQMDHYPPASTTSNVFIPSLRFCSLIWQG